MPGPVSHPSANGERKRVTLALQGGGAHGALTWGVLDRLAEEPHLEIQAISGTSAGALNATVFAYGLMQGGGAGAQQALHGFWRSVADAGDSVFNPYRYVASWPFLGPYVWFGASMLAHMWSPYDNIFYTNPLKPLLERAIRFEELSRGETPALFICATNVNTNERRIFHRSELSVDMVLASSCLPLLFRAVEVSGEDYWDGGYMGNPALSPLLKYADDLVIVHVNPINRPETPQRATDIMDRLNEITFNSALVHEIEQIDLLNKLLASGELKSARYRPIRFHAINAEERMGAYPEYTKSDTSWRFLTELRDLGRETASAWLANPAQFGSIGERPTFNVEEKLLKRMNMYPAQLPAA